MNDPNEQPGYHFAAVRLMRVDYRLTGGAPQGVKGDMEVDYSDRVEVQDRSVRVTQSLNLRIVNHDTPTLHYLELQVEVQGDFVAAPGANIAPRDFGNDHAPAILFPFTREWVHRLTTGAGPWNPILLPPLNVIQLRKSAATKAK